LCKRAGVRPFGFHALRRFVASVLQDSKKVDLKKIQLLLGHANLTTTQRYIYHLGEDLSSTVEVLFLTLKYRIKKTMKVKLKMIVEAKKNKKRHTARHQRSRVPL
jgi:hypothetical protein